MSDKAVKDNKEDQDEKYKLRWSEVRDLLTTNGEFFKITKTGGDEEWIRKDAIFSFRLSGSMVCLRIFGNQNETYISFADRWEALKLVEEIAKNLAETQK